MKLNRLLFAAALGISTAALAVPPVSYKGTPLGITKAAFLKIHTQAACRDIEQLRQTVCMLRDGTYAGLPVTAATFTFLKGTLAEFDVTVWDLSEQDAEAYFSAWEGALVGKYGSKRIRDTHKYKSAERYQASRWELRGGSLSLALIHVAGEPYSRVSVSGRTPDYAILEIQEFEKAAAWKSNDM